MKTTIIVVRHGYSVTNVTNTFAGHLDAELNETGKAQAEMAAEYLKYFEIDKIYSSDLKRAYSTALPIAKKHNLTVETKKELREICAGDWEGHVYSEIEKIYPEQYSLWMNDIGKCEPENGEKVSSFFERIKNAVFDIARNNEGKTVCITTHATPIRVLKTVSEEKAVSDMTTVEWCANASISIFEFENDKLKMIKYGITDHLGDNVTVIPKCI